MSASHPSGIFIPDEHSTPFTLDLLDSSSKLTIKVGSWIRSEEVGGDLQLIKMKKHGAWLMKVKHKSNDPQVLDDLCFIRRYFRLNGWNSTLGVDSYSGGNIIYLYPPKKVVGNV